SKKMEDMNQKIRQKLESYQELFDANQRLIYLGQKLDDLAEKYFNNKDKKTLIGELLKTVEIENSKRKKLLPKEKKQKEAAQKKLLKEVEAEVKIIREQKKEEKARKEKKRKTNRRFRSKVGDRVR